MPTFIYNILLYCRTADQYGDLENVGSEMQTV